MAFAATPNPLPPEAQDADASALSGGNLNAAPQPMRSAQTRQAQQQYQRARIETATPTQLVVLLYDGAIRFCTMARKAMLARDIDVQNTNLLKSQRIVTELMSSLDRNNGGQVADNLFQLYAFMLEQLVLANMNDNVELIDGVVNILRDLRESWQEIDRITLHGDDRTAHTEPVSAVQDDTAPSSSPVPANPRMPARPSDTAANRRLRANLAAPAQAPAAGRLGDRDA